MPCAQSKPPQSRQRKYQKPFARVSFPKGVRKQQDRALYVTLRSNPVEKPILPLHSYGKTGMFSTCVTTYGKGRSLDSENPVGERERSLNAQLGSWREAYLPKQVWNPENVCHHHKVKKEHHVDTHLQKRTAIRKAEVFSKYSQGILKSIFKVFCKVFCWKLEERVITVTLGKTRLFTIHLSTPINAVEKTSSHSLARK